MQDFFRKSSIKNEKLQALAEEKIGKKLNLKLDCTTRWNSLLAMTARFLELKLCIPKALKQINSVVKFSTSDWEILENIRDSLRPCEIAVMGLCTRESTLLTAEVSFQFIVKKLSDVNNPLKNALKENILKYYRQRTNNDILGLLTYLHDPRTLYDHNSCLFSYPTKAALKKTAEKLIKRLFPENNQCETDNN